MTDNLENLSDEELINLYSQKTGKNPVQQNDNLDNLSDDELLAMAQQNNLLQKQKQKVI